MFGGSGMVAGVLVPVRYPAEIPVLPALIVPVEVEIEIELLLPPSTPWGTDVPWFCARIPTAPELMVTPGSVVMSTAPNVETAKTPCDVVPVIVAALPTTILSKLAPLVRAKIPWVLPDTLP